MTEETGKPLWQPGRDRVQKANLTRFKEYLQMRYGLQFDSYQALHQWSVDHPAHFWGDIWRYFGVIGDWDNHVVLEQGDRMPGATWFPGASLNFAENLLRERSQRSAIVFRNEAGMRRELSYRELFEEVRNLAAAMRRQGIAEGDRVAGLLPNIPEAIIAMLATTSLGAVWTSCSPDFGVQGVLDRFSSVQPKLLFCATGYVYNGTVHDSIERIRAIAPGLPSLETIVVVPYPEAPESLHSVPLAIDWHDFAHPCDAALEFVEVDFDAPLYILYSSGTTGKPKCIVHGTGGTLLQHLKELALHTDLKPDDTIFFYTTCGWMMWNWLVSSLSVGARVVLWDGAPMAPSPAALFDLIDAEQISIFGISARYIAACEKAGLQPVRTHQFGRLHTILSTGSPLLPEHFDYVYREIREDVCLASISGGTDIISCFALGNPWLPVYRGELQGAGLGMDIDVVDETGASVTGEKGELVCRTPFPSMPVRFWNDPDGQLFRRAYFSKYPETWAHGDYARMTARGGLVIYGRSDAVLNPGGVRIGTAEIYRQTESIPEVIDSVVIGQQWAGDIRVVLFVQLREGAELEQELEDRIREVLRAQASPKHVPAVILQVNDIPRTMSGKITEIAVRDVVHGRPVKNTEALANPEALDQFRDRPELAG